MLSRSFWYKHTTKVVLDLLQAVLAGLLALTIVSFPVLMDGDVSLREVGLGFENTQQFLTLTGNAIRDKIATDQNREL